MYVDEQGLRQRAGSSDWDLDLVKFLEETRLWRDRREEAKLD
jgi:hypothetical protein